MKWLIQEDVFREDGIENLVTALSMRDIEYKLVKYIPFEYNTDYNFFDSNDIFVYGSINLVQNIQSRYKDWNPIAYCDWEAFKCSSYYSKYGERIFNGNCKFYKYKDLAEKTDEIFNTIGIDGHVFMRPDTNDKSFAGQVVSYGMWHSFCEYINPFVDDEDYIVISFIKEHLEEYRFVVYNDMIITGSLYHMNDRHITSSEVPIEVLDYAQKVASKVKGPHPIYVLDIVKTIDDELKVMEIGSVNCAGLYSCDVEKIVEACEELWSLKQK